MIIKNKKVKIKFPIKRLWLLVVLFYSFYLSAIDFQKCYRYESIANFTSKISHISRPIRKDSYWLYTISIGRIKTDIYIPILKKKTCIKTLLVLPGWNFSRKKWFRNTNLISYLNQHQYIAIAPEMGKTVYESRYFPETRLKWNSIPGMIFIEEVFLPFFQKEKIFTYDHYNFALGLSTGGRGVVMIAARNPTLFFAIATLSGDFDQTLTPRDNLMTLVYGPYPKFKKRWQNYDNPVSLIIHKKKWQSHIYIGHGIADPVVSYLHSKHLYTILKKHSPHIEIYLSLSPGKKHNFSYWNQELGPIFSFFQRVMVRD